MTKVRVRDGSWVPATRTSRFTGKAGWPRPFSRDAGRQSGPTQRQPAKPTCAGLMRCRRRHPANSGSGTQAAGRIISILSPFVAAGTGRNHIFVQGSDLSRAEPRAGEAEDIRQRPEAKAAASCRAPGAELRRLLAGVTDGADPGSQPPAGALTWVAASVGSSGLNPSIASLAVRSDCWSRRGAARRACIQNPCRRPGRQVRTSDRLR